MGDVRDPETDQPAPQPGGYPVQAVLIEALKQRMEFGLKKYGTPLETHNGRNPLLDMWEEMLDMVSYFTQFVLEQGVELPGLEKFKKAQPEPEPPRDVTTHPFCPDCNHNPHAMGRCRSQALNTGCGCQHDFWSF